MSLLRRTIGGCLEKWEKPRVRASEYAREYSRADGADFVDRCKRIASLLYIH